jgi:hypothetical protein
MESKTPKAAGLKRGIAPYENLDKNFMNHNDEPKSILNDFIQDEFIKVSELLQSLRSEKTFVTQYDKLSDSLDFDYKSIVGDENQPAKTKSNLPSPINTTKNVFVKNKTKPVKKVSEKDKDVKRPSNPFFMYRSSKHQEIMEKYGRHLNQNELIKVASVMWKNESEKVKQEFKDKFYEKMKEYHDHFPVIPYKSESKKKIQNPQHIQKKIAIPRYPPNSFFIYRTQKKLIDEIIKKYGHLELQDFVKIAAEMWNNEGEHCRNAFKELFELEMRMYRKYWPMLPFWRVVQLPSPVNRNGNSYNELY